MEELAGFILITALLWFWLAALGAREKAVAAAQRACTDEGWQLLDETVSGKRLTLTRDENGRIGLRREYRFEFTDTGDNRRSGFLAMEHGEIALMQLQPHLYVVPQPGKPAVGND